MNNLHNKDFWESIPGLIKDGLQFVQSGGQAQAHYGQYATVGDVEDDDLKKGPPKRASATKGNGPPKAGPPARKSQSTPPTRASAMEDSDDEDG